jgi:hypothetical protein
MIMERDAIRISELDGTTVVKIGRTAKDITGRMKGYPKGSRVIAVACVANSVEAEKRLISLFDDKFTQEEDHGREYYSGDLRKMQKKFLKFSMTEVMFEEVEEESESEETNEELVELADLLHDKLVDMNLAEDVESEQSSEEESIDLHPVKLRRSMCNKCGKKFAERRYLDQHKRKKVPCDKRFICPKCFHVFKTKRELYRHEQRITPCDSNEASKINDNPNNICSKCYHLFATKGSLTRHLNTCKSSKKDKAIFDYLMGVKKTQ